ncbi:MAG: hypothetical protein COB33_010305 [Thiotrichaceae bacterium]|nr:hypothetical protein [Thiotrichaceae bacterium]
MILGKKIVYGAIFCISLSGCGGGSGGDGVTLGTTGLTYTGLTTQASLTTGNGEQISTRSYKNGGSGQGMGTIFTGLNEVDAELGKPWALILAKTLVAAVNKIEPANSDEFFTGAVVTESDSFDGSCGGNASFTMAIDDETGDFNGSMTFNRYCESEEIINGSITLSGSFNAGVFSSMTMAMTSVSVTSGSDTVWMDGTLSFNPSATTSVITMNMKLKAGGSSEVFWMESFTLTIAAGAGGDDLTMAGRFYHPSYGYVNITTPTAFHYTGSNQYPFPGTMVAAGSNGSVVTLVSLSTTVYQISIDTDGDGNFEQIDNGLWAEL